MIQNLPKPKSFTMQWHITNRCNWACSHCYQDGNAIEELEMDKIYDIMDQFIGLLKRWDIPENRARINLTGGEPLLHKGFFDIADRLKNNSNFLRWGVLSNGSLLTKNIVKKLKDADIFRYQISLEGLEETNDQIRGKGTYKRVIKSIRLLKDGGVNTVVSLTLTKNNVHEIPELVKVLDKLGVTYLGTRRLIPIGRGSSLGLLEPNELKKYYQETIKINKELRDRQSRLRVGIGCESGIFNENTRLNNYCAILDGRIIIVMPNGDVLPCRRLPVVLGNLKNKSLFEIYYSSEELWKMRNLNNAHVFCKSCTNFNQCFGGAKCVNYCYANKLSVPDVQCWKYFDRIKSLEQFNKYVDNNEKEVKLHKILENAKP